MDSWFSRFTVLTYMVRLDITRQVPTSRSWERRTLTSKIQQVIIYALRVVPVFYISDLMLYRFV